MCSLPQLICSSFGEVRVSDEVMRRSKSAARVQGASLLESVGSASLLSELVSLLAFELRPKRTTHRSLLLGEDQKIDRKPVRS